MAKSISMIQKDTGLKMVGYYGFSWTTFFFGFIPALFRRDFLVFLGGFTIQVIFGLVTAGLAMPVIGLIWAFWYNRYYTRKLIEKGYVFAGTPAENDLAASALGVGNPTGHQVVETK